MEYYDKYLKYKRKYEILKKDFKAGSKDNLNSESQKFVENLEAKMIPPLNIIPLNLTRSILDNLNPPANIEVNIDHKKIINISTVILRPIKNEDKLPVIIYSHGGGWVTGSQNTHDRFIKIICTEVKAVIIFVNYTLAPEAKYPTQINEVYNVASYVYNNPEEFNIDKSKMVIMGDSAGGNIAIAVTLLAKEKQTPKFKYQILMYPVTDINENKNSLKEFENAPILNKENMKFFINMYLPNIENRNDILVSPLNATIKQLENLPPALIIIPENDPLRDDGENYAHKLMKAKVDVSAIRILGTIHGFLTINELKDTAATKMTLNLIISQLQNIL